jgi:hypothetical protein
MLKLSRPNGLACGLALVSLALAGCGGGGGGGSGSSSSSSSSGGSAVGSLELSVGPQTVDLFAPVSQTSSTPAIVQGTLTGAGSGTLYLIITTSAPGVVTVQNVTVGPSGGSAQLVPGSAAALGVGLHTATVTVAACVNSPTCTSNHVAGSPKVINVNFTVAGIQSSVSSLTYNLGEAPLPADFTRTFNVASYQTSGWTATVDIPFLSVTPDNVGTNASSSLTASIAPSQLDAFESGTYTGNIHLAPNMQGQLPVDIPVTVSITRTRVNFVAPYVGFSGRADEVIIRGESFNAAPPTGVRFGNVPATSFRVVSNTEIRAAHPALAAGAYIVHVDNAQGIDRTTAELHIVDAPTFAATSIEYPNGPQFAVQRMLYDNERRALLLYGLYNQQDVSTTRVVRYAHGQAGWLLTGSVPVPYNSSIALSTDGRKLFLGRPQAILELDPVSLATIRSTTSSLVEPVVYALAVANDGQVIFQTDQPGPTSSSAVAFSPLRRTFARLLPPEPQVQIPPVYLETGATAASGDGSRLWISRGYYQRMVEYVSGSLTTRSADVVANRQYFIDMLLNRRGDLILSRTVGEVSDGNLNLIGRFPINTRAMALAPELPRAYGYDENNTIRVFDTSAPPVGGQLVEVLPAITPIGGEVIAGREMMVSADGGTLFYAGYDRLLVQPLP